MMIKMIRMIMMTIMMIIVMIMIMITMIMMVIMIMIIMMIMMMSMQMKKITLKKWKSQVGKGKSSPVSGLLPPKNAFPHQNNKRPQS